MPDSRANAAAFLRQLEERLALYQHRAAGQLRGFFKNRDRHPPEDFRNSSFLYIRSFDGDIGERPFADVVYWHSPDLLLTPLTGIGAYTTQINAGETYEIRCTLRNRGDLAVPSAKVELYLTDPTLGFDTRYATNLTLGNVPTAWVPSGGSAVATFAFTVPSTEAGHKCLFARVFSFSPLEMPLDNFALDPRFDRHVAQQNLNIVGQAQAYHFNLVHAPNARLRVDLKPMKPQELLGLRHPLLADVRAARQFPQNGWGELTKIESVQRDPHVATRDSSEGLSFRSRDPDGLPLEQQRELGAAVRRALGSIRQGGTRLHEHRRLFADYRRMNEQARLSRFAMKTPDLDLKPGEAVGVRIVSTDENTAGEELAGGITLVIVG